MLSSWLSGVLVLVGAQMPVIAEAGFHVVVPDRARLRPNRTGPEPIEAYGILNLTADIVGLVQAARPRERHYHRPRLGRTRSPGTAQAVAGRTYFAVGLMSVPMPRSWDDPRPTDVMRAFPATDSFTSFISRTGRAGELEASGRSPHDQINALRVSADLPQEKRWRFIFGTDEGMLNNEVPAVLPAWITSAISIDSATEFTRTGFRGGLNWYRNLNRA